MNAQEFSSDEDEDKNETPTVESYVRGLKDSFELDFDIDQVHLCAAFSTIRQMAATLEQSFASFEGSGQQLGLRDAMLHAELVSEYQSQLGTVT